MASNDDAAYRSRLEAAKRASVGQLLFKAARLMDEQALSRIRISTKQARIRRAHTAILPHLDLEGTRLTTLAERLGVSKQAAGQLVEELEQMGMLERLADPQDGRAKLICFSARGRKGLLHGLAVLRDLEDELAQCIGRARMSSLRESLAALTDELERRAPPSR